MAVKDIYIVHLKPDQTKSVPERINGWGVGSQNGHQALYIHPVNLHVVKIRC